PDAAAFEVDHTGLYLKAGTTLNAQVKSGYDVTVAVDDPTVAGGSHPAATAPFHLTVTSTTPPAGTLVISEVAPWGSGNTPYAADWFEVTNTSNGPIDLTGWKMDDNSHTFANAVALNGVTTLPAGDSAVFIEDTAVNGTTITDATIKAAFSQVWYGSATPPAGIRIGFYGGTGVGLSQTADEVNLYDASQNHVTGVAFGASG